MPYRIRHATGKRPFQIVNLQTGEVVGTSKTLKDAKGSIGHRMDAESKNIKSSRVNGKMGNVMLNKMMQLMGSKK